MCFHLKRINDEQVTEMEMEDTRQGILFLELIKGLTLFLTRFCFDFEARYT